MASGTVEMGKGRTTRREATCLLGAHLPLDRCRELTQGPALPERSLGAVLLADVSGFTPLMEHLALTLGAQQGAEELTLRLNALFAPLIAEVHGHGGSIVAFGGDALTCWFPGERARAARQSAACALAMQRRVAAAASVETPTGAVAFSMHVGIATGAVRRFCVGRPPHGLLDVLAGATLERMVAAQERAGAGQVVVDAATAACLPDAALLPSGEDFFLLSGPVEPAFSQPVVPPPPLPVRQARRWLATPLYRRLRAGSGEFSAELRLVASLFARFIGPDYDDDPQAGEELQRVVALAQECLERTDGHLALVTCGSRDTLLHVVFGAPVAHEDDPSRAVSFALDFRRALSSLPFVRELRIGVSHGRVYAGILGSSQRCTYTVLGDEVNVSARLMHAAEAGGIIVSQRVRQAAADHYDFRSLGAVPVKGKAAAVPAFEPLSPQERRRAEGGEHLVGRVEEQRLLTDLLAEVESGRGRALTVEGEAGVGKSALVRALVRRARERGWQEYVGACLSYGQLTSYLPWRAVLGQACGLTPEMGPSERAACLEEAVRRLADPPGRPGYWRARFPLLAEAMGLEAPETPLTRSLEGELRRDNTFQLLEALVRDLAVGGPAVVVLEDAYWADELSLALAVHIARGLADLPLLLVLVNRPHGEAGRATLEALSALPHQVTLSLAPLEPGDALELARERLHSDILPQRLESLLRDRAQGNPFFIEELLQALWDSGCLRRSDGAVEPIGDWESLELPDTIGGVVRARLDRLPEEERLTLKVAAVIGRTFARSLLWEVHPAHPPLTTLERHLARLERAAFTQEEAGAPDWRYAFRHPILHEVAYETLLFAQRRRLHGAIGAALESRTAGDPSAELDLLAYHFARSEQEDKAVHYLLLAGDKARREYAHQMALEYYRQGLQRVAPEDRARRYDLLAGQERIYNLLGDRSDQERGLVEMRRLADELADPCRQAEALNRWARMRVDTGDFQEAQEYARQAWQRAGPCGAWAQAAEAQKTLGIVHASRGEYEEAQRSFNQAREIYRVLDDRAGEASCLGNLGLVQLYRGEAEQARGHFATALGLFRALENRLGETRALVNLGIANLNRGAIEQALDCYRQALEIAREIGSVADEELALGNLGMLSTLLGDFPQAAAHHRQALQLARRLEDREGEATSLSNLGLVSLYLDDLEGARHYLREALERNRAMGRRRGEAHVLHHFGLVELRAGAASAAMDFFHQALALRQEIGETGNGLATRAWLALACLAADQCGQAETHIREVLARLEAEGYGGDYPEQEVWWAAYCVWRACGESARAQEALERACQLVHEQAERIEDPALRRSLLEHVPVNREIVRAHG